VADCGEGAAAGDAGGRFPPKRITGDPFTHMVAAFRQGLKEEGYIDGQNVTRRT
jgi:hypothetical protein